MAQVPRGARRSVTLTIAAALAAVVLHAHLSIPPAALPCRASMGPPLPLPLRALDVAFLGPDRLVVLAAEEVALFALGERHVAVLSRKPLPGPLEVVRVPGGLLQGSEREAAVWAMTSRSGRAVLFALEGSELVERQQADALPFPGCPRGLRFRPGTNLLEGDVEGLGPGPFLDVVGAETAFAVSPEGRLLRAGPLDRAPRVGPTVAPLWPGLIATSLPVPPGEPDVILFFAANGPPLLASCPTPAPVRAIAARLHRDAARLAVAVDEAEGRSSLLVLDIGHPTP